MIYRLLSRFFNYFPDKWFERQVWIPSENELVIETAAALALRGVKVAALKPAKVAKFKSTFDNSHLIKAVLPVFQSRAEQWVLPVALKPVLSLFSSSLNEHLFNFEKSVFEWDRALSSKSGKKQAILMNSPGTIKGQSLSVACRRKGIPIIAAQHGVAVEISKLHGELSVGFDNSVPDAVLTYNAKVVENEERSHFKRAEQYIVGASSRHNRMRDINSKGDSIPPIVYISTNLYRGNIGFFISSKTDFLMARDEQDVIKEILSQLPYQVRYKTYPDDNRRYVDCDPVLNYIKSTSNIELFSDKVDMRYLLAGHRVLVTSSATSTLSWPVMTGKPVVFINWKNKSPLTNEAHKYLSKGLFLFDDDDENFHNNVREFLSQSIEDIERLWQEKESDRTGMIKKFFSAYSGNSGKRAAQIILSKYM
jgi:hypothetical protein